MEQKEIKWKNKLEIIKIIKKKWKKHWNRKE